MPLIIERYSTAKGTDMQNRLKGRIFSAPLSKNLQKYVTFQWKRLLYQFFTIFSSKIFYKINEGFNIFAKDIMYKNYDISRRHATESSDTFLLQNLGFLINADKLILETTLTLEFLGVLVYSQEMMLSFPKEKWAKINHQSEEILEKPLVLVRELSKLIGRLQSTTVAALLVPLQCRTLQQRQIQAMEELHWWIQNRKRKFLSHPVQTDNKF